MMEYFIEHYDIFLEAFIQHIMIVCLTLLISIVLASILSYLILWNRRISAIVVQLFGIIYSIPSLALFAILIPITGLGNTTAITVLVAYNQFLLLRNIITGMEQVDAGILEAAKGMGMTRLQVVKTVQVPLAMPAIIAGIRLAIISTTGIATIAATINAGGLGVVLFAGLRTMNIYKIVWGTILCMLIGVIADMVLKKLEQKWKRKAGDINELSGI